MPGSVWSRYQNATERAARSKAMKERKFEIGDCVRNTRTKETGIVTAFDLNPEVYSIKIKNGGFSLWGELEMENEKMELNFWVEVIGKGKRYPLRDNAGNLIYFSKAENAEAYIDEHGIHAEIVPINSKGGKTNELFNQ
jgi:hypothetical protein